MNKLFGKYSQERWAIILLIFSGLYLMILFLMSDGLFGETDSVNHYLIARYSFKHPYLLLDHWGKPLFTVLSSPFAQFGMVGAVFFNVLCSLFTAWLIFRMARFLKYRYALAAIPFALFAPVYMVNILTSLTEILFALVLVAGIYFFLKEKMILSSVIISFLPFARMEGMMFLVIFAAAFILAKKYKAIPFLVTGFIIFSIAGLFRYHDLLWFINAVPYGEKGSALYGHGSFWYYLERFHQLLGFPLTILAVIGIIHLAVSMSREKKPGLNVSWLTEYYLIPVSLFGFILAHSFLWWQGMMGVLATSRFMACVLPLGGFLALVGLNRINSWIDRRKNFDTIFTVIIILITIWVPYTLHKIPAKPSWSDQVMKATAEEIKEESLDRYPICYSDPKLAYYFGIDPYDSRGLYKNIPNPDPSHLELTDSTIVVWDTHFSEFEHKIRLEKLLYNPCFRLLDVHSPFKDKMFFTGQQYMSAIFMKVPCQNQEDQWTTIKSDEIKLTSLGRESKAIVRARVKVLYNKEQDPGKIDLVLTVLDNQNETNRQVTISGSYFQSSPGQWFEMYLLTQVSTLIPENGSIKLSVSCEGDQQVKIEGLCLDVLTVNGGTLN
jgi:hypothetical protein